MKRASHYFSNTQREEIRAAIAQAEGRTSGEIVPVVATASGRYDRAEDIFGILFALLALIFSWLFFQSIQPVEGDWTSGQTLTLGLPLVVLIVVAGFILGSVLATLFPVLRLPFIPRREMEEEVERRAGECFYRFGLRKTKESTGILIYISLYEHRVRILGDDAIAKKLKQEDWNAVRDLVIDGIRTKRAAEGLKAAILKCGDLLSTHFPIRPDDMDELKNELYLID